MSRILRIALAAFSIVAVVDLLTPESSAGAPAFARKYRISCTTCHAPPPRLKPFGEEFAGRGFRMEGAQEPTRAYYDTGDPLLLLPRDLHIGLRMEGFASWKEDQVAETDVEFPWVWKIISGGPLSESASYYFYFLVERGEVEGLEDAYLQLNGLFGLPVDLIAGQFQVSDPLFKRELRLERFDYLIYKASVGDSRVDLTYDRGLMFGWAFPGGIETILEIVTGSGIAHADDARNFDRDKYKNAALRLTRSFGPVRVGVFGYYGKEEMEESTAKQAYAAVDSLRTNEMTYWGPDLTLMLGRAVEVNAQYLERRDDHPFFLPATTVSDIVTRGGFAEIHAFPQGQDGRWVLSGLYNRVESDDPDAEEETVSLTVSHLLARNLRLLIEGGRDLERETNRATVGLVSAF